MDSVSLDQSTEIVGLFDISISKVDNTIFVANKNTPEPGAINTFALYADETGKIKSAGSSLLYETETEVLTAPNILNNNIISDYIVVKKLVADKLVSENIEVKTIIADSLILNNDPNQSKELYVNYLNFLKKEGTGRFASIHTDFFGDHTLAIVTENNEGVTGCALTIDGTQRITIQDGKLNLKHTRTIASSVGIKTDRKGDLAIDNNYLYYCTRDFNRVSNIWVRWKISDNLW
jgi:hypothetical protein